jgi:hypothetical protein
MTEKFGWGDGQNRRPNRHSLKRRKGIQRNLCAFAPLRETVRGIRRLKARVFISPIETKKDFVP